MSEDPFMLREEVQEEGQDSPRELPVIDVVKLEELVGTGDVPASVLTLYKEITDEKTKKVFLTEFADAEPDRQQKMLRALQRTSDKVQALPEEVADHAFKLSLTTLIAFLYTMFVARMMTRITTDPSLDPGKNEEGAWLRILELSGKEVFTKPEQFEIKDVVEFIKKLIYSGHGREVLEHLDDIPPQYHADVVFHCLQISRQKTGKLEVVYVLETLPKCKELTLDVAKQLCRLGFDQEVMEGLMSYKKDALQEVTLLLLKREKLPMHDIFKALLAEPTYLKYQVIITACYFNKKILEQMQLPENKDLSLMMSTILKQVEYLHSVESGSAFYLDRIRFIPSVKFAKKALRQFGSRDYDTCNPFARLLLIQEDVMKVFAQEWPWQKMDFTELVTLSEGAAEHASEVQLNIALRLGPNVRFSSRAASLFSERRGWFVTASDQGETELLVSGDRQAEELAGKKEEDAFTKITEVSLKTATLLVQQHQGPLYLENVKCLSSSAAVMLLRHKSPVAVGGLTHPEGKEEFDPMINKLLYEGLKIVRKIGPDALHGAMLEAQKRGMKEIDLPHLEVIGEECAELLAAFHGNINLPNIKVLTVVEAAALARHHGGILYLQGLHEAGDDVIEVLSRHQGTELVLGLKKRLSDRAAIALGTHKGRLFLGRITEMSLEAQKAMSVHKGELTLAINRTVLPEKDPFYQARGWYPDNYVHSDSTAIGWASLGRVPLNTPLTPSFLSLLEKHCKRTKLDLDVRTSLTSEELNWMAFHWESEISLRGLKTLTTRDTRYLGASYADLHFAYGIEMSHAAAKQMAPYWKNQFAAGHRDLPGIAFKVGGVLS